jgi:GntR family transcriptional regulator
LTKRSPRTFKPAAGSGTPLYLQLARFLSEAVRSGQYESNEALPSERALSESLGLSRVTTRKAIDQLTLQGLIVRRRGSGNYIAAPRVEQALSRLTSFSEDLRARGYSPSSRWLSREITPPTDQERELLRLPRAAKVARLKRLRIGDETVMALEECVLPASVLPDPTRLEGSLYEYLEAKRSAPVRASERIQAINASAQLARHLRVPTGRAVLFIQRVSYLASGTPLEVTCAYCRSDYFDLVAEMRRDA